MTVPLKLLFGIDLISIESERSNLIKVEVMETILYLRGLNSQGDDSLRAGGLAFGPMHGPWLKELRRRGYNAVALTGFGAGRLSTQIEKAKKLVRELPEWQKNKFYLLGHSTGGLLARALAHELKEEGRIVSVVTMATPHRGSPLVEIAKGFSSRHPLIHRAFCAVNYDINQRLGSFQDLALDAALEFNEKYPDLADVDYASVVFKLERNQMSWPVRLANSLLDEDHKMKDHDGYVEASSQQWGKLIAEMDVDHLGQTGFSFSLNPLERRRTLLKFGLIADHLARHWQDFKARGPGNDSLHSADL